MYILFSLFPYILDDKIHVQNQNANNEINHNVSRTEQVTIACEQYAEHLV